MNGSALEVSKFTGINRTLFPHISDTILSIDFKGAYNSINMSLLYERMKKDKVMEDDRLTYLFGIYSRLTLKLDKESFPPKNGVPQGGINSPILFNYAMYYFLTEAAERINSRIEKNCGSRFLQK